jgi:NAD(P)-dependent dehydrogenase (short-subunit alcohol dehydrogenase family)
MLNEMTNNDESKKDEVFASFTKDIPMGRPQEPIDIANMTLFLCSDEANNITGQNIGVDGGQAF